MRLYQPIPSNRKTTLISASVVLMSLLCIRYIDLQILNYDKYQDRANSNSIRQIILNAPRGIIFDRNGLPLVDNRPTYDLMIIPIDVTEKFDYQLLSNNIGMPSEKLKKEINKGKKSIARFRPKLIKRHVNFEIMSILEEYKMSLPGIIFSENPARTYVSDSNISHALGYLRTVNDKILKNAPTGMNYLIDDVYGAAGLEKKIGRAHV